MWITDDGGNPEAEAAPVGGAYAADGWETIAKGGDVGTVDKGQTEAGGGG